ncbi:hypothetical protein QA601_02415 [Chitinispirillales bacterium ANBcel5]|uniref:hypothetical protein n=1 Tax=Cellulosispirillum alkaliphilum TaxID=3039283 RepID=UPI002A556AC7|nr:hypothetical protein [Chitinispirillales bacterium ANBcel5]
MSRTVRAISLLMIGAFLMIASVGCGPSYRVSEEDQIRLDEAREAAEAAERKLAELRHERRLLEEGVEVEEEPQVEEDNEDVAPEEEQEEE